MIILIFGYPKLSLQRCPELWLLWHFYALCTLVFRAEFELKMSFHWFHQNTLSIKRRHTFDIFTPKLTNKHNRFSLSLTNYCIILYAHILHRNHLIKFEHCLKNSDVNSNSYFDVRRHTTHAHNRCNACTNNHRQSSVWRVYSSIVVNMQRENWVGLDVSFIDRLKFFYLIKIMRTN